MVAKVISGKNIRGILQYNEQKVEEAKAEYLLAHKFGAESDELSFGQKLHRFERIQARNGRVKTNAIHISLNFDVSEKLARTQLVQIARVYMDRIGFGEQPYLVYQHHDAAHPHLHIVTTNIGEDGKRMDMHNIGRNQSEAARKEIEELFALVPAEGKQKLAKAFVLPADPQKAQYGKSETKRAISDIVRQVTRSYKYTSLAELNAVLGQFNVTADRGGKRSQMFQKKGLSYSLLDEHGHKVGIPIKASAIYGKPTLSFLEKQFSLNEMLRRPHAQRIKTAIDQVLQTTKPPNREGFIQALTKASIFVIFRENRDGRGYGITFVDHQTKTVFNGSDLGKAYAAKVIMERLNRSTGIDRVGEPTPTTSSNWFPLTQKPSTPPVSDPHKALAGRSDQGLAKTFKDLISAQTPEGDLAIPGFGKRRRKKKKRMSL